MKVLKFGGTSVGTAESLQQVKHIVEGCDGKRIVVVSALGGVTDALLQASALAEAGDPAYRNALEAIADRHFTLIDELFGTHAGAEQSDLHLNAQKNSPAGAEQPDLHLSAQKNSLAGAEQPDLHPNALKQALAEEMKALRTRLDGVYTLKALPDKTRCEIVSYGERMSAAIRSEEHTSELQSRE